MLHFTSFHNTTSVSTTGYSFYSKHKEQLIFISHSHKWGPLQQYGFSKAQGERQFYSSNSSSLILKKRKIISGLYICIYICTHTDTNPMSNRIEWNMLPWSDPHWARWLVVVSTEADRTCPYCFSEADVLGRSITNMHCPPARVVSHLIKASCNLTLSFSLCIF